MSYEDDKRELEIALMSAQIDKLQAEAERFRQEMRWEPYKAMAAFLAAAAGFAGVILAVAHFIRP